MENNQIYSSVDENEIDGTIFVVDIEENETSLRLNLRGEYSLRIWDSGLSLLTLNTELALYHWPYTVLRRYGTTKSGFTFEGGRKSQPGPGVLRFGSPSGKLITQTIKETVNKIKGYNFMPNTDSTNTGPSSLTVNSHLSEEMTGDYTKYSQTTDRPKRRAKPQEPHTELSLEIPPHYNSNRIAGHSLSNPGSQSSQSSHKERPQPPATYYNENFNRPVGPSFEFSGPQSLEHVDSIDYCSVGNNTVLIDYSLPSPQGPSSLTAINSAPILSPRAKSPNVPLPYGSFFKRVPKHLDTLTKTDKFTKSDESILSCTSTFPTCVSPPPDFRSSPEDSSSDDETTKKPAIRKISQAQTTRTELTEDLELKQAKRISPVCHNYVNLKREHIVKTLSNPGDLRPRDQFKLAESEHHSYINVTRQQTTQLDSDYYNVTPELLPEEKRRSNTDTALRKTSHHTRPNDINFSPLLPNGSDLFDGPSSFPNMQDMLSAPPESEDILYANVQMHPSSRPKDPEQLYVNTPTNPKPTPTYRQLKVSNKASSVDEHDYAIQSGFSITQNSTLPFISQAPPSNPRPNSNQSGFNTTQQVPARPIPRYVNNIESEYSYLTEILKQPPNMPQAYNTQRGLPSEYK